MIPAHIFAFIGGLCFLSASLGIFRMPDTFSRLHAATKASSLGVICLCISAMIEFPTVSGIAMSLLILFLVFLTAPMACHAISAQLLKESHLTGIDDTDGKHRSQ